ncbi:MAG TPA: phosphoribosylglycinamide formyltransferase [Bacteroidota bacterium]|nr:phosphoribosylglycinamide formyltransferase [Bacteroidota bacterium]
MLHLAVFASGTGSNLRAIHAAIEHGSLSARLAVVLSNRREAGALDFAREHGIPAVSLAGLAGPDEEAPRILEVLRQHGADFVALAGYMRLVPSEVVAAYGGRMLNIHPALLPSFGGKGMYGHHVHEAVLAAGVKVTGVTVHLVDELYDRGPIVMQACVPVHDDDSAETLAARVLLTEHQVYARALQLFAEGRVKIMNHRSVIT